MSFEIIKTFENMEEGDYSALGKQLGSHLQAGDCIALEGALGAGKTSFARALIRHMTANPDEDVPSPTFTILQQYQPSNPQTPMVWHFDLYRLERPDEMLELGLDEALDDGIILMEWPEKAGAYLPKDRLQIQFHIGENSASRTVALSGTADWATRLEGVWKTSHD